MKYMKTLLIAVSVLSVLAAPAWAQVADEPAPTDNAVPGGDDDVGAALEGMSPEELEKLIAEAMVARLRVERQQVIGEIQEELLYEPADVKKATSLMRSKPADTQADNIQRIMKAFAIADPIYKEAYSEYQKGSTEKAIRTIKKTLSADESSYLAAAKLYLLAEAYMKEGKSYDGVETFTEIMVNMPERISFAASASLQAAEGYEKLNRGYYAMQTYAYALKNYGLTLDKKTFDEMQKRFKELHGLYSEPMKAITGMMGDVESRLAKTDSGKATQAKQERIVALLGDLIKVAEEQQKAGGQGQGQSRKRGKKKSQQQGGGKQSASSGSKPGQPKGTDTPSSPAQSSRVVPGAVERPNKLSAVHGSDEDGNWSSLPARERRELLELRKKLVSDRERGIAADYTEAISREEEDNE